MYLAYNSNLLYHGCIPTDENGDFAKFESDSHDIYSGKALFGGDLSKAEFTYDVEVERKPMSPLEKILDDSSKSMNLYYKAMDAIHKAKKEKEND